MTPKERIVAVTQASLEKLGFPQTITHDTPVMIAVAFLAVLGIAGVVSWFKE